MRGCTQCGECLAVCPVFRLLGREEYAPKAKRLLLEEALSHPEALPWPRVFSLSRLCAGCGRCRDACARKLSTPDLLAELRARHPHWTQHAWEFWMLRAGPLWSLAGKAASLWPDGALPESLRASLASAAVMAGKPPSPWLRLTPAPLPPSPPSLARVLLFGGCTARNVRPRWTATARALLLRRDLEVLDDNAFTCCGTTLHHAGREQAFVETRQRNIRAWQELGRPRIATFCASCGQGLAGYATVPGLFPASEAALWRESLCSLSALLGQPSVERLPHSPVSPGYHQPCHARHHDADEPFLRKLWPALQRGTGLCCGLGGVLKMTDPGLSEQLGKACLEGLGGCDAILTGCGGCALQLAAVASGEVQAWHWLDVVTVA